MALLLAAHPAAALAQRCAGPVASYAVSRAGPDLFGVRAAFHTPTRHLVLRFSEAIGRPEAQAASVLELEGTAGDRAVAIHYDGEGAWSAAEPLTAIHYQLRADHDEVRWTGGGIDEVGSHFGDTYFFVANAFFPIDDAWPSCPVEVDFDLPEDWSVLAPWPGRDRHYVASDPSAFEKNAFAIGRFAPGYADAGTMRLEWVIDDRLAQSRDRMIATMTPLPRVFNDFFGSTPADRYVVIAFQGPSMDGGAFRQSFTLTLGAPVRDIDALVWSHYLAHEMIHLWLGNTVRGEDPEDLYWFTEGFTDYLAIKLGYRAGITDEAMLEQRLANVVRRVRLATKLSPGVGLVEAGKRKNRNWELVYGGGAMVAMLMDAADPASFQLAMRDLMAHAGTPYTQASLLARMDSLTDGGATRAFTAVDAGLEFGTIVERLGRVGIEVTGFSPDEVYVRFAGNCSSASCVPAFLRR
jgi:predicted metalloprotease with PDZ domain